jgi:hypothetical protein
VTRSRESYNLALQIQVRSTAAWRDSVTKLALIAITVTLLLGGTSLATAKTRATAGTHHYGSKGDQISRTKGRPSAAPQVFGPGINETASRPPVADPYYRLSDSYYGSSDPYHALFDFYAAPPYSPGNAYGYVRPIGR